MKHRINFSSVVSKKPAAVSFEKTPDGAIFKEVVFFTDVYNRNNAFFQVSYLMKFRKSLSSIMFNFNHDLEQTGGVYLGNQTKILNLQQRINDGVYEVYGDVETKDKRVLKRLKDITAVSIELEVDDTDVLPFANGKGYYFKNIDWMGVAFLTGLPQGSGNARLGDIQTFNQNNSSNMNKDQLKEYLKSEEGKAVFAEVAKESPEVLGNYQTSSKTIDQFKNELGETIKIESERVFKQQVTKVADEITAAFTKQIEDLKSELATQNQEPKPEPQFKAGDVVSFTADDQAHIGIVESVESKDDQFVYKLSQLQEVDGEYLRTGKVAEFTENKLTKESKIDFNLIETKEQYKNRLDFEKNFALNKKLNESFSTVNDKPKESKSSYKETLNL